MASTMTTIDVSPHVKRVCLQKEELELLSKEDLIKQWLIQEKYINSLEVKSGDVENSELVSLRESEEKLKQQQLEATRRENILVMRLTTKEQEMQEYASQIQELKQSQVPTVAQLRTALLDPAVNLVFERMRKEVDTLKARLEETQNELSAWKFTPDSNTGKRLMAKCRSLYQENEELGKMISAGRLAKLEGDLALQRNFSEEMKKSQTELDEFLQELDEDVEGMQSTIIYLQQNLRDAKEQLKKLQVENEILLHKSNISNCESVESTLNLVKPVNNEPNTNFTITNHKSSRNSEENSFTDTSSPNNTPTGVETLTTPDLTDEIKKPDSSNVLRMNSPRSPKEKMQDDHETVTRTLQSTDSVLTTLKRSDTPDLIVSPETCNDKDIVDQPPVVSVMSTVSVDKPPNSVQENGLKQGVICYGHQSLRVGSPSVEYKRETSPLLIDNPRSPVEEIAAQLTINNQYKMDSEGIRTDPEISETKKGMESFPLDLVKKPEFMLNHSPISSVVVSTNVITSKPLNSLEQLPTNLVLCESSNVIASASSKEEPTAIIVPKLRLLATVQNVESALSATSPSPPQSPINSAVVVSAETKKRTLDMANDDNNVDSPMDVTLPSSKRQRLISEPLTSNSATKLKTDPSSPPPIDKRMLMVDIDTEVQVAQTLACWAVASSKERTRAKSPNNDQIVSGMIGNGDFVEGSNLEEGQM